MLKPIRPLLDRKRIILASESHADIELIRTLGINATLFAPKIRLTYDPFSNKDIVEFVEAAALRKANHVFNMNAVPPLECYENQKLLIIASESIATLHGRVVEPALNKDDALRILNLLNGSCHRVYTSVVLKYLGGKRQFTDFTDVYFGEMTSDQLESYVDSGFSRDRPGAYTIDGAGGALVEKIVGDYYNVVGLPLHRLCKEIHKLFTEGF